MYAGMLARWHEVTSTTQVTQTDETLPLFWFVFSSDKGTEEMTDLTSDDFYKMYGDTADFFKYGQPLIEAHRVLDAGARILGKRLVAPDSTLANIIISAEVTEVTENKYDADGNQLYINDHGEETKEITATAATVTKASIKYSTDTVANAKSENEVLAAVNTMAESDTKYPLFVIMDNGRGVSVKKVKITPDYTVSKRLSYQLYNIVDIENTSTVETKRFSFDPDAIYVINKDKVNMSLTKYTSTQFNAQYVSTGVEKFLAKLAEITAYSREQLLAFDVLFACTVAGKALTNIVIDDTGVALDSEYGIALESGTNGSFGDAPFVGTVCSEAWEKEAKAYFSGEITDEIYDLDLHKIDYVPDANYPDSVKNAIVEAINFRKDAFFFRDLGVNIWSCDDVIAKVSAENWVKTPFAGDYCSTYEVIDAYSKKQIRVTSIYSIAPLLVKHFGTNIAAPLAGEFNNFVITDAIKGSLNFTPRHTPKVNQKEILDDLRVNFINHGSNTNELVVQSTYTSQDHFGPLSYINNVIVTQMAVKAVRRYTPKIRFQLVESNDFSKYKQLIEDNVLPAFKSFFQSIELVYTQDDIMAAQKIFNASLECYYYTFAQSEIFDVYAIDGSPSDTTSTRVVTDIN